MRKKIKRWIGIKIIKLIREKNTYKKRIMRDVLLEQEYIDKMNLMKGDIRDLLLKLNKKDRDNWLKKRGGKYEGFDIKKK